MKLRRFEAKLELLVVDSVVAADAADAAERMMTTQTTIGYQSFARSLFVCLFVILNLHLFVFVCLFVCRNNKVELVDLLAIELNEMRDERGKWERKLKGDRVVEYHSWALCLFAW